MSGIPTHKRELGFDSKRFYFDIRKVCKDRHTTMSKMCAETGVDNGSLSRVGTKGAIPDGATLAALCKWSGLNIVNYHVDLRGECDA